MHPLHLSFDKEVQKYRLETTASSTYDARKIEQLQILIQASSLSLTLHKISYNWIKDPSITYKTLKLLEDKVGSTFKDK